MVNPHRQRFVEELANSASDFLDEGYDLPFDEEIVRVAADRVYVRGALTMALRDRRPVLAWLLRRYLNTLNPRRPGEPEEAQEHP